MNAAAKQREAFTALLSFVDLCVVEDLRYLESGAMEGWASDGVEEYALATLDRMVTAGRDKPGEAHIRRYHSVWEAARPLRTAALG